MAKIFYCLIKYSTYNLKHGLNFVGWIELNILIGKVLKTLIHTLNKIII